MNDRETCEKIVGNHGCIGINCWACHFAENNGVCEAFSQRQKYIDTILQAKQWLNSHPEPKKDAGHTRVINMIEELKKPMTYAEKQEADCKYIDGRLQEKQNELVLRDGDKIIAEYIDGKFELMPSTLTTERTIMLADWLIKLLETA
jgi:hypothetical protein